MAAPEVLPLVVAAGSLVLSALLVVPSLWQLRRAIASAKSTGPIALKDHYEDEDGVATEQDEQNYSDIIPRTVFYIAVATGVGTSIASAVLTTVDRAVQEDKQAFLSIDWITVGTWILLLLVAGYVTVEKRPVYKFNASFAAGEVSILILANLIFQTWYISGSLGTQNGPKASRSLSVHAKLTIAEFAAACLGLLASLSQPRRPSVNFEGKPVEAEFTISAWSRLTFNWANPLLRLAAKRPLELEDLPVPAFNRRSENVLAAFNPSGAKGKFLKLLILTHWVSLLKQLVLTMLQTLFSFTPQLSMFFLLRELEKRGRGEDVGYSPWVWVATFALGYILYAFTEYWMFWISITELLIPFKSELSAMIFTKAMRSKDIKEVAKAKKEKSPEANGHAEVSDGQSTKSSEADEAPPDEEEAAKKQRQSIVNLIAIDTKRVSDFGSLIRYFPQCALGLGTSLTFLVAIIGWIPLISGLLATFLLLPTNILLSRRYNTLSKQLMKLRDEKLSSVGEALGGMRQIKFSALESQWENKILEVRGREISQLWKLCLAQCSLIFCWNLSPLMLSTISLAVYAYREGGLAPSVAFTALGVFNSAQQTFVIVPHLTTMLLEAGVSLGRITTYLDGPEKETKIEDGDDIEFKNATISWPRDITKEPEPGSFALRNVNLKFPQGELSVISGKTGSGKSLLLASIFGESEILSGKVTVPRALPQKDRFDEKANSSNWILPNSVAFVAQIPWIENASIKDNIVFGLPVDESRYKKTLSACALTKDLEMLEDGDATEIGATGINLSGGQRWRVTLARALYSRAGILVMDDIFSAVDTHVGRSIFDNALVGELSKGRTRILATHHAALVISKTAYAVQLGKGTVEFAGVIEELSKTEAFKEIIKDEDLPPAAETVAEAVDLPTNDEPAKSTKAAETKPRKFVEAEFKEVGAVKKKVYSGYLRASGGAIFWLICVLLFAATQFTDLAQSWWIVYWTGNSEKHSQVHTALSVHSDRKLYSSTIHPVIPRIANTEHPLSLYIGVYLALGTAESITAILAELYIFFLGIKAARNLFQRMTAIVLRMPLRWVDTVPTGRILNRFTGDFNTIDKSLPGNVSDVLNGALRVMTVFIATVFVSPSILVFGVFLVGLAVYVSKFYLNGARSTKRLDSITKSPVLEQLGSAIAGVNTIRAFDKTDSYQKRMFRKIDNNTMTMWYLSLNLRWFTLRLTMLGVCFTTAIAILVVTITSISAALAGFALTFALRFSSEISWFMRTYSECEINMNAAERVLEYTELTPETAEGKDVSAAWPTEGKVSVNDIVVAYAEDLPAVLKGLSFEVEGGQRVGVIGRTGAGKSSLALTLFRFLEARSGTISIDGEDISKLKLFDLRSRLAIIPQDPTIFSGTIRSNLDPFEEASDKELQAALLRVHLASDEAEPAEGDDTNRNIFNNLASTISEGGLNLSQGQRQLLCLARSIVKRSKVMILDEATSAVDMETDALIQRSIREDFQGSTLLVIAHRLSTIADFDRILVMGDGRAEEFGTPKELLAKKGAFYEMVQQSGEKEDLEKMISA